MTTTSEHERSQPLLEGLVRQRKLAGYGILALAAVLAVLSACLGFQPDDEARFRFAVDWDYWPQAIGGALLTLVALGAGLWLVLVPEPLATVSNVRRLLLAAGGLAGLVIALATLGWAVMWWQDIFTGGLEAWRGPNGWRLWACIGFGLAGLVIMFASLLLARREERSSAAMRRLLYGYNAFLTGLLLVGILIMGNLLIYAWFPATYNWTKSRGIYSLSTRSKNILSHLEEPVQVYVIMAQRARLYQDVRLLLDNCQAITDKLKVQMVSPGLQPKEVERLQAEYPKQKIGDPNQESSGGILLVYGTPATGPGAHTAFIPTDKLYDVDEPRSADRTQERTPTWVFKGEDALLSELSFLAEKKQKPRVYFTQANGEYRLNDRGPGGGRLPSGLGILKSQLEQNNFEVLGLRLQPPVGGAAADPQMKDSATVPRDASVLVIVNPVEPFRKDQLEALRAYVQSDGKLLVLLDFTVKPPRRLVAPRTGLEPLLAEMNVAVPEAFVIRYPFRGVTDLLAVPAVPPEGSSNAIARALSGQTLLFFQSRPVRLLTQSRDYQAETVLEVPEQVRVWTESDLQAMLNPERYAWELLVNKQVASRLSRKPIPVAAAVTANKDGSPRLVVCGNAKIAANTFQTAQEVDYDFLENALQWLLGRAEKLGIPPQKSNRFTLNVAAVQEKETRMRYLPAFLMAAAVIGLGAGIWIVRRR